MSYAFDYSLTKFTIRCSQLLILTLNFSESLHGRAWRENLQTRCQWWQLSSSSIDLYTVRPCQRYRSWLIQCCHVLGITEMHLPLQLWLA